eukprot:TRINITY_DN228_c0_g3_i1.p1 TRINITY_DN228_c0_g3~~TRINITY_DN228_c0_g3_i1.p1  ORF type:complete len:2242 (+),score=886.81 TRINITY_DN228_c0_g3_i1:191-6916(+)
MKESRSYGSIKSSDVGYSDDLMLPSQQQKKTLISKVAALVAVFGLVAIVGVFVFASSNNSETYSTQSAITDGTSMNIIELGNIDAELSNACFGDSQSFFVTSHVVEGASTIISGKTQIDQIPVSTIATRTNDKVVIEATPESDDWNVYDGDIPLEDSNGWSNTKPLWVFSNTETTHKLRTSGYNDQQISLSVGLNSVGEIKVADNKPFSMIFGADENADSYLDDLFLKIQGVLKPALRIGTVVNHQQPISLGNGLSLENTGFTVEGTDDAPKYSLFSTLVIKTNSLPPTITLGVSGIMGDDSFTLTGTLDHVTFGIKNPVWVKDVSVTVGGTRDVNGKITVTGSLTGTVSIGQFSTTLHMDLPFSLKDQKNSVSFTLDEINVNSYFTITNLKGTLQSGWPYFNLAGNGVLETAASNVKIALDATYSQGGEWSFNGSIANWIVNVGDNGITIKNASVSLTEAEKVLSVKFAGDVNVSGYEAEAQMSFTSEVAPVIDLKFTKNAAITARNLASTITTVPNTSSSVTAQKKILDSPLSMDLVTVHLDLAQKAFIVDGLMSEGSLKNMEFRMEAAPEKFAAGFMIHKSFQFSEVVPQQTGFDGLNFQSGAFVLANHEEGFNFNGKTIQTENGLVFETDFITPVISDNNPSTTLTVSGTLLADKDQVVLKGKFAGLSVGPHIVLKSGSVIIASVTPQITIKTDAGITIGSQTLDISASVTYGTDKDNNATMNFHGALDKWVFKWHSDISLSDVAFNFVDNGSGFTGDLSGSLLFGSVVVKAKMAYPITNNIYLDFYAPDIPLSEKTHLKEVTLHMEDSHLSNIKFNAVLEEKISSKTTLTVPVSGSFTENSFVLDGTLKQWTVAQTGMTGYDCHLHLQGDLKNGEPMNVSGEMDMDLKILDTDVKAALPFPLKNNDVTLKVSGMELSKDAVLNGDMDLHFDEEGICESMSMSGDLAVALSAKTTVDMKASGKLTKDTFDISAEVDDLKLGVIGGRELDLEQVKFHLAKEDPKKTPTGQLDAKMSLGDIKLDVEINYPLTNLQVEVTIPVIRLTKHAKLTNVEFDFNQGSKSIALKGTLNMDFDPKSGLTDLALTANGSIVGDKMHLEARIPHWTIPVGHSGLTVTNFLTTVDTTTKDSAAHTKIALSGDIVLSNQYDLSLNGSFDSNTDVVTLDLDFKNSKTIELAALFDKTVTDPNAHNIPSDLVNKLHHTSVRNASIELVTKPWKISVKGDIRVFGNDDLIIGAEVTKNSDNKWYFTTSVSLTNAFSFSSIIPSATSMNEFKWEQGILAITNAPTATVEFAKKSLTMQDGVLFQAILPMVHLSQRMEKLKMWSHVESFIFTATWQKDTSHIQFVGELPKNMPVGKDVTVDGKIVLNLIHNKVDLDIIADAHITLGHDLKPLDASVEIEINNSGFTLTGKATEYTVPAGHKGIELEDIELKISEINGHFSGDILAKTFIGEAELSAEVKIPCPDNQMGVEIILMEKNQKINVGDILNHTCDSGVAGAVKVPGDLSSVTKNPLIDAKIIIKTYPLSFEISADLEAFKGREVVNIELEVSEQNGVWGFGFGVGITSQFHFSDVMPSFGALEKLPPFVNGAFVFAYQQQPFVYKAGGLELSVSRGIAFGARAHTHAAVQKWTGIDYVMFKGAINFATHSIHLEADLEMDWHLGDLYFYEAGMFLDIGGSQGFDLGIMCNMMVKFNSHNELRFGIKIMFAARGIVLDGYTLDDWHQPFGIKGLTVDHSEVEVGFSYAFAPFMFGISGGLEVGPEKGAMTLYVDPSINTYVIAAKLNEFNLGKMVSTLTHGRISSGLVNTFAGIEFKGLDLELNTGSQAVVFNQQTFNPGFLFKVDEFTLMNIIHGDARVMVNPHVGLSVAGHIKPFSFAGGLVKVSGYSGSSSPASLDIAAGVGMTHFKLDGRVNVVDVINAGAKIAIDDTGVLVDLDFRKGVFDFIFKLSAHTARLASPADFSIYGEVNLSAINTMMTDVANRLKVILGHVDASIGKALNKVKSWEAHEKPKIDANNREINQLIAEKQAHLNSKQRILHSAMHTLEHDKAVVSGLQNHINWLHTQHRHCHWYQAKCHCHNIWVDARIAATWVEEKVAMGVLNVAESAVRLAERAVSAEERASVHLDPRIVALKTDNAAIIAAGHVAEAALNAAKKVADDLGELAIWGLEHVNNVFELKRAYFSASSLASTHRSGSVKMGLDVVFFGKEHDWELDVAFPPSLDNIHSALWNHVHSQIHK